MPITGKVLAYYAVFGAAAVLFVGMLRLINSPFGRVLQAIRENDFRAEALGYSAVVYRSVVNCLAAGVAAAAGVMTAVWLRYTGPNAVLSFSIMLDILLMLVIGGIGSLYGAIPWAAVLVLGQAYLQDLLLLASDSTQGLPLISALVHPDRWLLWLGVSFILFVYRFSEGYSRKPSAEGVEKSCGLDRNCCGSFGFVARMLPIGRSAWGPTTPDLSTVRCVKCADGRHSKLWGTNLLNLADRVAV